MPTFGMLALGVFMGSIITFGIRGTTDWKNLEKTLGILISVAFSGGLFAFFTMVQKLGGNLPGDALFMYPVGLVLGTGWVQAIAIPDLVGSEKRGVQLLGWLHAAGLVIITLMSLALLFSQSFRDQLPSATVESSARNART